MNHRVKITAVLYLPECGGKPKDIRVGHVCVGEMSAVTVITAFTFDVSDGKWYVHHSPTPATLKEDHIAKFVQEWMSK